jgi:hypothetical protein
LFLRVENKTFMVVGMRTFPVIEKLGGRQQAAEIVSARGKPVTADAVRMWCQRGQIPGWARHALHQHFDEQGVAVMASDFEITSRPRQIAGRAA